jgi:enoyl-CoA hydratase/carnithine racemase
MAESSIIDRRVEERATGRVAFITVNNAERRNALTIKGKGDLIAALRSLALEPELRVVVITGAGEKSFIGGADLREMSQITDHQDSEDVSVRTHVICNLIRELPVPVIARINGYCLGAGMEIAASCDMRVGVETAKFGMPEVRFGVPCGMEACLLPGLIGWGKTRELVFTGDLIDARDALQCGFLQRLVEREELDAAVERWVSSICAGGPRAIRLQKRLNRDWERMSITDAVQQGIKACIEARTTDEPRRMAQAFVDRKKNRESQVPRA